MGYKFFLKSSNNTLEIDISKEKSALPNKLNPKYKDSEKKKKKKSSQLNPNWHLQD